MRAGRRSRLAGLVLALAAVVAMVTAGAGEFQTYDFGWSADFGWSTPPPADSGGVTAP